MARKKPDLRREAAQVLIEAMPSPWSGRLWLSPDDQRVRVYAVGPEPSEAYAEIHAPDFIQVFGEDDPAYPALMETLRDRRLFEVSAPRPSMPSALPPGVEAPPAPAPRAPAPAPQPRRRSRPALPSVPSPSRPAPPPVVRPASSLPDPPRAPEGSQVAVSAKVLQKRLMDGDDLSDEEIAVLGPALAAQNLHEWPPALRDQAEEVLGWWRTMGLGD